MLKKILSIAGRPGLYRLVSSGKNMLIVEYLATGKRIPAYARDKVVSLGDISIYTDDEDVPLTEVFDKMYEKFEGKTVDVKALGGDEKLREVFGEILPNFDRDRVYTTDIRKVFAWYNRLIESGITKFKNDEISEDEAAEAAEKADDSQIDENKK